MERLLTKNKKLYLKENEQVETKQQETKQQQ